MMTKYLDFDLGNSDGLPANMANDRDVGEAGLPVEIALTSPQGRQASLIFASKTTP